MRFILPVLGALLILIVSCQPPVTPGTPSVEYEATETGANLRLTWTAVTDAQGYYVYLDGVKNTVTTLSYDVTTPTKLIEVTAYNGSEESGAWSLNTSVVETENLMVYTTAEATQANHAFYFTSSGSALAIPLTQATDIDFVVDTSGTVTNVQLRSPDSYTPHYNDKDNAAALASTTVLDSLKSAPAPGVYNTVQPISGDAVYSLWIDPTNNGWSKDDDHFAKAKVVGSIVDNKVTLTLGYQKIPGLRWLISN